MSQWPWWIGWLEPGLYTCLLPSHRPNARRRRTPLLVPDPSPGAAPWINSHRQRQVEVGGVQAACRGVWTKFGMGARRGRAGVVAKAGPQSCTARGNTVIRLRRRGIGLRCRVPSSGSIWILRDGSINWISCTNVVSCWRRITILTRSCNSPLFGYVTLVGKRSLGC